MEQIKIPDNLFPYFEKAGTLYRYQPGETIYIQGKHANKLFFIKSGRVRAFYVTKSGKELTFEIVEKGQIIVESALLAHSVYPVSAAAVNQAELLACDLDTLSPYMDESPELMRLMLRLLSRTCYHLTEQLRRITLYDRYQKIASFLLHETAYPDYDRGVTPRSIPYTQEELAVSLGLNRVTVSRVLNEWKKNKCFLKVLFIIILRKNGASASMRQHHFTNFVKKFFIIPVFLCNPHDPNIRMTFDFIQKGRIRFLKNA